MPVARAFTLSLATSLVLGLGAVPAARAGPLSVSRDGREVLDPAAHLAWDRCLWGQRWSGQACTGTPVLLRQSEALARAREQARQSGQAWRLPRVAELQKLPRRGSDGLDPTLFPGAPADWHWSGTPALVRQPVNPYNYGSVMRGETGQPGPDTTFVNGWAVHLGDGQARDDVPRQSRLAVRLVRDLR